MSIDLFREASRFYGGRSRRFRDNDQGYTADLSKAADEALNWPVVIRLSVVQASSEGNQE